MTDEEIMFDFFTIQRNRELAEEDLETESNAEKFELDSFAPGETRTFAVKADKKEFEKWFKANMGADLTKYLE